MHCAVSFSLSLIHPVKKENLEYGYGCHDAVKLKNLIDLDRDGKISDSEFNALVKNFDFNSTGFLEGFEYRIFSLTVCKDFMRDFDSDRNGKISKEEYKKIVLTMDSNSDKKCCKEEIPRFFIKYNHCVFQCIDSNKDGKVSETEWLNAKKSISDLSSSLINSSCSFSSYLKKMLSNKKDFMKCFDKDKDKKICDSEWADFYKQSEKFRKEIIRRIDRNKNSRFEADEKKALYNIISTESLFNDFLK
jgi:Ca2+-binding EF-hand superfamily protein